MGRNNYLRPDTNYNGSSFFSADLSAMDLFGSSFVNCVFDGVNFENAGLVKVDFSKSSFHRCKFKKTNLSDCNFEKAKLDNIRFEDCNMTNVSFCDTLVPGCIFEGNEGFDDIFNKSRILPEGDIIGWKKCENDTIVKLLIPAKARRSHAFTRKCRAERANVLEIKNFVGVPLYKTRSMFVSDFQYVHGECAKADRWDEDWTLNCGGGIHFFITRYEAEAFMKAPRRTT